jgi:hypothetical protein
LQRKGFLVYRKNILLSFLLLIAGLACAQTDSVSLSDALQNFKASATQSLNVIPDSMEIIVLTTDTITAMPDSTPAEPIIAFDTAVYQLGSISQGDIVKQRFTFRNTGNADLEIISVVPDCSCTSPEWTL